MCRSILIKGFYHIASIQGYIQINTRFHSSIWSECSVCKFLKWNNYTNRWDIMDFTVAWACFIVCWGEFVDPIWPRTGLAELFAGVGLKAHWDVFMGTNLQPNNKSGLTWLDSDALDLLHLKPHASHHFCVSMAMEGDAVQTPWQQQIMWNKIWAPYCAHTCVYVCGLHLAFLMVNSWNNCTDPILHKILSNIQ